MPSAQTTRALPYSAQQMFELVAGVEHYPEFVPLCSGMRVLSRDEQGQGRTRLMARMSVRYAAFLESYTSEVLLDIAALEITARAVDGPFSHLENHWRFEPNEGGGCRVIFSLDYAFKSRLLQGLMGAVFDRAFAKFIDAFEARADAIYGSAKS